MGRCATCPQGVLTPALLDGMRQHKPALHALVEGVERTCGDRGVLRWAVASRGRAAGLAVCAGGRSGVCRAYDAGDTMSRHAPHDVRHVQCRGCCVLLRRDRWPTPCLPGLWRPALARLGTWALRRQSGP